MSCKRKNVWPRPGRNQEIYSKRQREPSVAVFEAPDKISILPLINLGTFSYQFSAHESLWMSSGNRDNVSPIVEIGFLWLEGICGRSFGSWSLAVK